MLTIIIFFLFLLLTSFVFFTLSLYLFSKNKKGLTLFLNSFLLFLFQVIATEMLLGFIGLLTSNYLAIVNIIIGSLLLFFSIKKVQLKDYFNEAKIQLNVIFKTLKEDKLLTFLTVLAILVVAWALLLGLIFPIIDWDGNSYHMTFIGNVFQYHNIFDHPASLGWIPGYPKAGELITLWNVIFLRNDVIADLTQIPFAFMGVAALYGISKKFGATKNAALFSSLLFITIPVVTNQLKTTYLDIMIPTLFFAAIFLLLEQKDNWDTLGIGIAAGIIFALKPTGFIFTGVLGIWLIFNLLKETKKFDANLIKSLAIFAIPVALNSYWYFKNLVLYHNPLYPFGYSLAGHQILPGKDFSQGAAEAMASFPFFPKGMLDRIWYVWSEQKDWWGCLYNYDANFTGFGPIWFIVILPAVLIQTISAIKNKKYLFISLSMATLLVLAIYPLNYYTRYTIFIWVIGIPSLALLLSDFSNKISNLVKFLIILLVIFTVASNFALCTYGPLTIKNRLKNLRTNERKMPPYSSVVDSSYIYLEDNIKSNEVVTYSKSSAFIYPLWNREYSNRVIYIDAETKDNWLKDIKTQKVNYVFTNKADKEFEWSKDNFIKVFESKDYEIFKTN